MDLNVEIHNLGLYFVSESRLHLEYSLSSTSCWFLLTISMSKQAMIAMNTSVSRLVITTHGRISIITRRPFACCSPYTRDLSSSRRTGLWTFWSFSRQSVPSLSFLTRSTTGLRPDPLVFTTSSSVISRFPEASVCRKLQDSPLEQDPFAFH